MIITAPRGTVDIAPDEIKCWQHLEGRIRRIMDIFGYKEIRTPIFEKTELFIRGVGEGTDIVTKEMYTFEDKGGRSITLRPEGTASVVRSYVERGLGSQQNTINKFYYISPMFRYERPQAGRLRQHHQFGVEALGSPSPEIDIEVMALVMQLYGEIGLKGLVLKLNSVGCSECRKEYLEELKAFLEEKKDKLCGDCGVRYEKNPLRTLDCKRESCRAELESAPEITAFLCDSCREHFSSVKNGLDAIGLTYREDSRLVRGLDYYTRTTFEVISEGIGAQDAISGGGRYDNLVEQLGGPPTPAIGFGAGIERLLATIKKAGIQLPISEKPIVFFAVMDEKTRAAAMPLMYECRRAGICCETDYFSRSLKAQFKAANKMNAACVVVVGEDELSKNEATVKDFATTEQQSVPFSDITRFLSAKYSEGRTPAE